MNFQQHLNLKGKHALLSASKYHWINYDDSKISDFYAGVIAKEKGTILHDFAAQCISLCQKLPRSNKTLNRYVNDAIGFRMVPEQILYYSDMCFGTADAICFRDGILRIHDLKTGSIPAHMEQLLIYAALFCLEYQYKPHEIDIELRIYQSDEVLVHNPCAEEIEPIMEKIILFDKIITQMKKEE